MIFAFFLPSSLYSLIIILPLSCTEALFCSRSDVYEKKQHFFFLTPHFLVAVVKSQLPTPHLTLFNFSNFFFFFLRLQSFYVPSERILVMNDVSAAASLRWERFIPFFFYYRRCGSHVAVNENHMCNNATD